jgi:hypothetical protein
MKKASNLVSIALAAVAVEILVSAAALLYFSDLLFLAFVLCGLMFSYTIVFFLFSKLLKAALRDAGLWKPEGRALSPGSAGWQMLWFLKPGAGLKRKIWLVYFLPIIALPVLAAEYGLLYYFGGR